MPLARGEGSECRIGDDSRLPILRTVLYLWVFISTALNESSANLVTGFLSKNKFE